MADEKDKKKRAGVGFLDRRGAQAIYRKLNEAHGDGTIANASVSKKEMAAANSNANIGPVDAPMPHVPHGTANALRLILAAWPVQTATVDLSFPMSNVRHANDSGMKRLTAICSLWVYSFLDIRRRTLPPQTGMLSNSNGSSVGRTS